MVEPDLIAVFGKDPDGIALAVTAVLRLCEEVLAEVFCKVSLLGDVVVWGTRETCNPVRRGGNTAST